MVFVFSESKRRKKILKNFYKKPVFYRSDSLKNVRQRVVCVLKKKKNNFFATFLTDEGRKVLFSKSCGMLEGVSGSKKYTTVAVQSLGQKAFIEMYGLGYDNIDLLLVLKFKLNKFVKSFVRGLFIYGRSHLFLYVKSKIKNTHNGLRGRKLRRV